MDHFVYRWSRITTGEYYIGIHSGTTDDGYIGSGVIFKDKYKNHKHQWEREIVALFGTREEAVELEIKMVTEETLKDPKCLNRMVGGISGPRMTGKDHPMWGKKHSPETMAKITRKQKATVAAMSDEERRAKFDNSMHRTEESKEAQRKSAQGRAVNVYEYGTDILIASNVYVGTWCSQNPKYNRAHLTRTLKTNGVLHKQHKGIYAEYMGG